MSTDFTPWDSGALGFEANPALMAIPGLMMDPSAFSSVSSPMMASPQQPQFFPSPPQQEFYSPSISPPVPSTVSSPVPPSLPLSLPTTKSSDGPQIRLNPLVMKPNLSHSLPVTTPFKKCVFISSFNYFLMGIRANMSQLTIQPSSFPQLGFRAYSLGTERGTEIDDTQYTSIRGKRNRKKGI